MSRDSTVHRFSAAFLRSRLAGYSVAVTGILAVTLLLEPIHLRISSTTVALSLLMVVLATATIWGSGAAALAAVVGVLCFNYFFLPPVGTWTIADPENWFALGAFLITAVIAGQLSAYAKRRAEVAEARRLEIERLYKELSEAFEKASYAEALKQSEKLKSALLDAVTHDIRTPLTAIKASVTTLIDEQDGAPSEEFPVELDEESRREMLEVINEETDRLNRFTEDLIELAKIEAGEVKLRRQWMRVDEIISFAIYRAKGLTERHEIVIESEPDLPLVHVDSKSVSEVLYILVDNAAKYSPPHTRITIGARRDSEDRITVWVEDEGPGIEIGLRSRIFDKFFRAIHDTESGGGRPPGTGMGLAIARGIVEAHEGKIWVTDSRPGANGAKFEFDLPIGDE